MIELPAINLLAIIGFVNAYFLHWQYRRYTQNNQRMYCLIGEDCARVVSSPYGTTFGVKNEVLGMYYYGFVLVLAAISISWPFVSLFSQLYLVIISLVTAIFSGYLLFVQTRILKNFCSWCLMAITINVLIFLITVNWLIGLWSSVS